MWVRHLFEDDEVVSWDFHKGENTLYCVMESKVMNVLRYIPERGMTAWTTWTTDDGFLDVCVLPGDGRNVPYFLVDREGTRDLCIETLSDREPLYFPFGGGGPDYGYYLDGGISGIEQNVTTPTSLALPHLEGETVTVVADGVEYPGIVLSDDDGYATVPVAASLFNIGLPYTSTMETLSIDYSSQGGSAFGNKKAVPQLTLQVEQTHNVAVGPDEDLLTDIEIGFVPGGALASGAFDNAIEPDWDSDGKLVIQQSHPYPMTIQTHVRDGQVSDV